MAWFISDHHFNHDKIIEYCNRPFANVEEMNNYMIKQWNSVVGKNDMKIPKISNMQRINARKSWTIL